MTRTTLVAKLLPWGAAWLVPSAVVALLWTGLGPPAPGALPFALIGGWLGVLGAIGYRVVRQWQRYRMVERRLMQIRFDGSYRG